MAQWNLCRSLLVLAAMTTHHILECKRTGSAPGSFLKTRAADNNINACCLCGQPITVTLIATNYLRKPFFEINATVGPMPQRELIYFLEEAAAKDLNFRFTAENFGGMGYMITKIHQLEASVSDQTFWHMREYTTGNRLLMSGATYVPMDNDTIVFNFTTYGNAGF